MNKELRPLKDAIQNMRMELDIVKHQIIKLQEGMASIAETPSSRECLTFMPSYETTSETRCRFCGKERWDHK